MEGCILLVRPLVCDLVRAEPGSPFVGYTMVRADRCSPLVGHTLGLIGTWAPDLLTSWAPGLLASWSPVLLGSWAPGLLGFCAPGHLAPGTWHLAPGTWHLAPGSAPPAEAPGFLLLGQRRHRGQGRGRLPLPGAAPVLGAPIADRKLARAPVGGPVDAPVCRVSCRPSPSSRSRAWRTLGPASGIACFLTANCPFPNSPHDNFAHFSPLL